MTNDAERVSDIVKPVAWQCEFFRADPSPRWVREIWFDDPRDTYGPTLVRNVHALVPADIIEAQSKALAEARVVRPLEWLEHANNERAETMLGEYVVWQSGETQSFLRFCGVTKEIFGPLSLAKAAAQADYAARILSALKGDGDK